MSKNPTTQEKFGNVIGKNTFYFNDIGFEEGYEGDLMSLQRTLLALRDEIDKNGLDKETFEKFLLEEDEALDALLALTGISNETLKRLVTIMRVTDDEHMSKAIYKEKWVTKTDAENLSEWGDGVIVKMVKNNEYFRKGLVNVFFEGVSIKFLRRTLPLFELKKLSRAKLKFEPDSMIDTLIRYKRKGGYSGKKGKTSEIFIQNILEEMKIPCCMSSDLDQLVKHQPAQKRTVDFIIPDQNNPKIIIESSFSATTSSQQGDKAKTEIALRKLIERHYPQALFIGFVDGIGWYVRKNDLKRMVSAYHDVFTFHTDEIERFKALVQETL